MAAQPAGPVAPGAWPEVSAFWWQRLPAWVRQWSLVAAMALADGAFLRRWPRAAAVVPPAAGLLGLLLGALHPGPLYSDSIVVLLVLGLVAGFGAGPGAWSWLGFVVGDLLGADRSTLPRVSPYDTGYPVAALYRSWLPLALAYFLLSVLLVSIPLVAITARWTARAALRSSPALVEPLGDGVKVVVQGVATMAWAYATAFLIRPLWSYSGRVPNQADIAPLQEGAVWLGLAVVGAALVRVRLERVAGMPLLVPPRPASQRFTQSAPARAIGQVALLSWLLSGLTGGLVEFVVLVAALAGIVALRLVVLPRRPGYVAAVGRVPVLLRVLASLAFSYLAAKLVVEPMADAGEQSFVSLVAVILASLLVGALLLPGRRP